MRKTATLLIIIFVSFSAEAQIEIAPKAGYGFSTTTFEDLNMETHKVSGFVFGVSALIGKDFRFQPEIIYIQKGYEADSINTKDSYEYINNYLQVPLLLNYGDIERNFRYYVNFGPYISYWLGGLVESYVDGVSLHHNHEFDEDFSDGFQDDRWDYGFSGGAGIGIRLFRGWLMLEGRYDIGFGDLRTLENPPIDYIPIRNRSTWGSLAYYISF